VNTLEYILIHGIRNSNELTLAEEAASDVQNDIDAANGKRLALEAQARKEATKVARLERLLTSYNGRIATFKHGPRRKQ